MSKRSVFMRTLTIIISVLLIMTFVTGTVFADSSDEYTKVKKSQYPKLMQGKLTKYQLEIVIEGIIGNQKIVDWNKTSKLSYKQIKKAGHDHFVNRIALAGAKWYSPGDKQFASSDPKDQWCEAHNITESNRILSFYTDYRYKKNKKKKEGDYYVWRTTSKKLYYYGGIGYGFGCTITSAKKYSDKIVLKVKRESDYTEDPLIGKYTVTLKKQKNGRFKLYSIKETWRSDEL